MSSAGGGGLSSGLRWSAVTVVGRELARLAFTVVLARVVGPEGFGIVAQALVYIGITALLLDQGFSSALIQRPELERDTPGAVTTVNVAVGGLLAAATVAVAPLWADFMSSPQLVAVLSVLAISLFVRSGSITPRAMLLRRMDFRRIGIGDISSAVAGGVAGVVCAELGAGYWALVVQYVVTDAVLVAVLLAIGAGTRPNLHLRRLRDLAGYSGRAFAAGILINSVSRNADNLLIGRFQGPAPLAFYGLAYRLLLLPVQLVGTTIGGVLFPSFSRQAADLDVIRHDLARATRALSFVALPAMSLTAVAAPQIVVLVFGAQWVPAVPIIQILAVVGAIQTIYATNTPLIMGLGRADINLRLAWLTTLLAVVGIVAGLPFGPVQVAVGYACSAVLLVPANWIIRRKLLGTTLRSQASTLLPAAHVSAWMVGAFLVASLVLPADALVALLVGIPAALLVGLGVTRAVHRRQFAELAQMTRRVLGREASRETDSPSRVDS